MVAGGGSEETGVDNRSEVDQRISLFGLAGFEIQGHSQPILILVRDPRIRPVSDQTRTMVALTLLD